MAAPNTNVFISGLPTDLDDDSLKQIFEAYGHVTWAKMMPSKGRDNEAGIVEFDNVSEAKWVVENLNGNIAEGLDEPITVTFKREMRKTGGTSKGGKGYGKASSKGPAPRGRSPRGRSPRGPPPRGPPPRGPLPRAPAPRGPAPAPAPASRPASVSYGRVGGKGAAPSAKGRSSPYAASAASRPRGGDVEICRNFRQWGECKFGASCRYSHDR
mmetsp:Transcript_96375/g.281605  ORF Transcript_96375/g.281605 Transcript_96375/m.281605 type:complete len:213 (+) Transcript_96375:69-707(+)